MLIISRTFCLLFLLASNGVILTSQREELHVSFIGDKYPVVRIKVPTGCSKGIMKLTVHNCPRNNTQNSPSTKVCTEEGAKLCIKPRFRNEDCALITGRKGNIIYQSSEFSLDNLTFYNPAEMMKVETDVWLQQGNTSKLRLKPVEGVSDYKLLLESASKNKSANCTNLFLTGYKEESSAIIVFTAQWHQQVVPGCTYRVWFVPKDSCDENFIRNHSVELEKLEYKPPSDELMTLESRETGGIFLATTGMLAFLFLVITVLLSITLHKAWESQRVPSLTTESCTPLMRFEVPANSKPTTILLVYTLNLQPKMEDLATRLRDLTGLQIEDLYDVGDQDKVNDPTVWLTRRLMDPNARFVLACSSLRRDEESSEELKKRGGVYFLLYHFLQYLHSTSLAYDYTRLHMVRFEDQAQVDESDATPGRVYQLPEHLHQLAINLTQATSRPHYQPGVKHDGYNSEGISSA